MYSQQYATYDTSLDQGSKYIQNRSNVNSLVSQLKLNLIQETTTPNLSSISLIEGMRNPQIDATNNTLTENLQSLENEFNTKLEEYQTKYNEYLTALQYEDPNITTYKGKNVRNGSGAFFYVNNFGYTREYSQDAWNNRNSSCPNIQPDITSIKGYSSLKSGDAMGIGQPCGLEGKLIRSGNKISWVTPTGKKREFSNMDDVTKAQEKGCPTTITDVTETQYNSIPSGNNMTNGDTCNAMNNDVAILWGELETINNNLITIATNIYNEINTLENSNSTVQTNTKTTKSNLMKRIELLQQEREKFIAQKIKTQSLMAKYNDLEMGMTTNYYHYLAWSLGVITLGAIAYKKLTE